MHSYYAVLILSFLILASTGLVPSFIFNDWSWFSRSGALLVVFGLLVVWFDYQRSLNKDLDTLLSGFEEYLQKQTDLQDAPDMQRRIYKQTSDKFDEVRQANKKRFQNIEFIVIGIGTLIWGYGDLLGVLFQ
jgi:hypothetical protein